MQFAYMRERKNKKKIYKIKTISKQKYFFLFKNHLSKVRDY